MKFYKNQNRHIAADEDGSFIQVTIFDSGKSITSGNYYMTPMKLLYNETTQLEFCEVLRDAMQQLNEHIKLL